MEEEYRDASEVGAGGLLDGGLAATRHVAVVDLFKAEAALRITSLNGELCREDVSKFGAISVASSSGFRFVVIEVRSSEEVSEDQLGDIDLVLLMHHDRDTIAIVPDTDGIRRSVDGDVDLGHGWVALFVVCGIH